MLVRMAVTTPGGPQQVLETEEIDLAPAVGDHVRISDRTFRVVSRAFVVPVDGPIILAILLSELQG